MVNKIYISQMKIQLTLPLPAAKKNNKSVVRTKTGRTIIRSSENYGVWLECAKADWRAYLRNHEHHTFDKCRVECVFVFPDRKRRDMDNLLSSVLDFLADDEVRAIKDDCWTCVPEVRCRGVLALHGEPSCVEVIVTEIE